MGEFALWWSNPESQSSENNRLGGTHDRPSVSGRTRWTICGICIFLAAITLVVFGQTLQHKFVNYDDERYVYGNPAITSGLTFKGIAWAFSFNSSDNWIPLTFISHMLDCQLCGLNAGGHHLTNVLLHTVAVIMLFLVLREMTGALWRSAFVAAVFAIHPLRVESVAWVTERKDVLSGVFFMLTLYAYVHYARRRLSLGRYLLVAFSLAVGLMSKPMLVTLPFVLLLLDYWPLNRFAQPANSQRHPAVPWRWQLVFEKVPLLTLSVLACVATILAQRKAIAPVAAASPALRIGNALGSYVTYIWQMLYPSGLAVFYPFPIHGLPLWQVALSFVLLMVISAGVLFWRRKYPYLLVGWFWYLGMLIPVIGLVQVGLQARADRYTYLPQVGLYLALTWAAGGRFAGWRYRRLLPGVAAAVILAVLSVGSFIQTSYWHNSESLWKHTLTCTSDNAVAHNNLGWILVQKGQVNEAIVHLQKAVEIDPRYAIAHNNFGNALLQNGQVDEAISHFRRAVEIQPDYARAHHNLAFALLQKGQVNEAITHFQKAVEIQPDYAKAHYNLGTVLLQRGHIDEAIMHYRKAVEVQPTYAEAHNNLANALLREGQVRQAIPHLQKAVEIQPNNADACNNLASILATCPDASVRNGARAVELAQRANLISGGNDPVIIATLAAAYAEIGQFPEAVATAQQALKLATGQNNTVLVNALRTQIGCYRVGSPFRDTGQTNGP